MRKMYSTHNFTYHVIHEMNAHILIRCIISIHLFYRAKKRLMATSPPDRSVPLQWLAPQFGMASLCRYAHSLERFLRHSFLNLRRFYFVVLGFGAPLSSPT